MWAARVLFPFVKPCSFLFTSSPESTLGGVHLRVRWTENGLMVTSCVRRCLAGEARGDCVIRWSGGGMRERRHRSGRQPMCACFELIYNIKGVQLVTINDLLWDRQGCPCLWFPLLQFWKILEVILENHFFANNNESGEITWFFFFKFLFGFGFFFF